MLKTIWFSLTKFSSDERGTVPVELVALSGAVLLLGATYLETHATSPNGTKPQMSEEVYVRVCGQLRSSSTTYEISRLPSQSCK